MPRRDEPADGAFPPFPRPDRAADRAFPPFPRPDRAASVAPRLSRVRRRQGERSSSADSAPPHSYLLHQAPHEADIGPVSLKRTASSLEFHTYPRNELHLELMGGGGGEGGRERVRERVRGRERERERVTEMGRRGRT